MSVLNYTKYINVSDYKNALLKLKDFAVAQGWTLNDYRTSAAWIGSNPYYWGAGSDDFLDISSAGYGSQTLRFRIQADASAGDSSNKFWRIGQQVAGAVGDNTASSADPWLHYNVGTTFWNDYVSLSNTTMPEMWLFGNNKIIIMVIRLTNDLCQVLMFGSIELFDTSETLGYFKGTAFEYVSAQANIYWTAYGSYSTAWNLPWWLTESRVYWDNETKTGAKTDYNMQYSADITQTGAGIFGMEHAAIKKNNFSGRRVMIKSLVYALKNSDSVWRPLGTLPVYNIEFQGLTIGEKIIYGAEEYLCFPGIHTERPRGFAVRIA